jgi:hypothetical protein
MAQPELQSIVTGDAHPTDAPFRISAMPGKNSALVTLTFVAERPVQSWRIVRHGTGNRKTGQRLRSQGVVAGLDRAGTGRALARDPARPLILQISQAELGAEGTYPLDVYAIDSDADWGAP